MRFIQKLRQRDILFSFVLTFFLTIIITLIIISFWFNHNVNTIIEKTILMEAQSETDETANCFEKLFANLYDFSTRLQSISYFSPQPFMLDPYQASLSISNFDYSFTHYSDMVIYYPAYSTLLTLHGTEERSIYFRRIPNAALLMDTIASCKERTILCTQGFGASEGSNQLILVQPLPLTSTNPQYYVLFFLNNSMIQKLLRRTKTQSVQYCLLSDLNNRPLWSNIALSDSKHEELKTPGISSIDLENQRYFVEQYCINNCINMTILLPSENRYTLLNEAYQRYFICCASFIVITILCFSLCVKRSYYPLKKVLSSYSSDCQNAVVKNESELLFQLFDSYSMAVKNQNNIEITDKQLYDFYILSCIRGYRFDEKLMKKLIEKNAFHPGWRNTFVILLLFQDKTCWKGKDFYINADMNFHVIFSASLDNTAIIGIVQYPENSSADSRETIVRFLFNKASVYGKVTISIGTVYAQNDMGRSYMEAASALEYRFIKGCNTTIFYEELPSFNTIQVHYPLAMLQKYQFALRTWDYEQIQQTLQDLLSYINTGDFSLQQAKFIGLEISSGLLHAIQDLPPSALAEFDAISISEYASLEDLVQSINDIIPQIINFVEIHSSDLEAQMVEQCRKMIREHYSDPQFSLTDISRSLDISPQTLRKKYKTITGNTLLDDLTAIRIERTKTLLIETNMELSKIVQAVGYVDSSSFIRLFKKYTNMSPGQYRIANRIAQNSTDSNYSSRPHE